MHPAHMDQLDSHRDHNPVLSNYLNIPLQLVSSSYISQALKPVDRMLGTTGSLHLGLPCDNLERYILFA